MANLTSDKNLDKHLKVIKSGEEITSLELATEGNGAKIKGDLEITGSITNTVGVFELLGDKIVVNAGYLYFLDLAHRINFQANDVDDNYLLSFVQDYDTVYRATNVKAKGVHHVFDGGTITTADTANSNNTGISISTTLNDSSDSGSCIYKLIEGVATNTDITGWDELYLLHLTGASTFYVDNAGNVALAATKKLYLDGGGDTYITEIIADGVNIVVGGETLLSLTEGGGGANDKVIIPATTPLYFDGGSDTYIQENSADNLKFVVGADSILSLKEGGNAGNLVNIGTSCAGFQQHEPTYDATDTMVYFAKLGNKAFFTFGAGHVLDLNLYFPDVSCSCTLVVKQDGTGNRQIANYKSFDQGAGNESTVKWAGGSAPTLSTGANAVDIISFYWDNDNHTAYGVASLNFS
tara:strand:- start:12177 stop:13403 length:1227 start_codon:yes stop_codon:yes gene_type:complete